MRDIDTTNEKFKKLIIFMVITIYKEYIKC